MIRWSISCAKTLHGRSVDKKDIHPTVIVVVEDGNTGSGGFEYVFFGIGGAEDISHRQPCFFGGINKLGDRRRSTLFGLSDGKTSESQSHPDCTVSEMPARNASGMRGHTF